MWEGGAIYDALEELKLVDEIGFIEVSPAMRIVGSDYDVAITSAEAVGEDLKSMFPAERTAIDGFLGDCEALASEMAGLMGTAPDLLGLGGKFRLMMKFFLSSPKMRKYGSKSYREVLNVFFKEPRLQAIFGTILPFQPDVMAPLMMHILGGEPVAYYPKGGAQALAKVLAGGVARYGGEVALNTTVTKILVENGAAVGVEVAGGRKVKSRNVVSNADGRQTFLKLLGDQYLNPKFVKELKETRLSESSFLVSLGVDLDLQAMGFDGKTIIYNRSDDLDDIFSIDLDKCYLRIMMHSLRDPSQAPPNTSTVQLLTLLPYNYMGKWKVEKDGTRGKEYTELKEALADKLIASAAKLIPDLSKHIVCKDIATPLTFERYTFNSEGAQMAWFPLPGGKMRSQKTPIKGLYQAGAWTFPGASLYAVVPSGRSAAQLIIREVR